MTIAVKMSETTTHRSHGTANDEVRGSTSQGLTFCRSPEKAVMRCRWAGVRLLLLGGSGLLRVKPPSLLSAGASSAGSFSETRFFGGSFVVHAAASTPGSSAPASSCCAMAAGSTSRTSGTEAVGLVGDFS